MFHGFENANNASETPDELGLRNDLKNESGREEAAEAVTMAKLTEWVVSLLERAPVSVIESLLDNHLAMGDTVFSRNQIRRIIYTSPELALSLIKRCYPASRLADLIANEVRWGKWALDDSEMATRYLIVLYETLRWEGYVARAEREEARRVLDSREEACR